MLYDLEVRKWRMLRRALKKDALTFDELRSWCRMESDRKAIAELVRLGLLEAVGDDVWRITEEGRAAADMGEVEVDPATLLPPKKQRPATGRKAGRARAHSRS